MLQIQPEKEIVIEFIRNEDYTYVRLLGAFYLRLIGKPTEIFKYLEPLYNDYRKIRKRTETSFVYIHVDEFIDELLREEYSCDIALPFLPRRHAMEFQGLLEPRISALAEEMEISSDEEEKEQSRGPKQNFSREVETKRSKDNKLHIEYDKEKDRDKHKTSNNLKEERRDDRRDNRRDDRRDDRRDNRRDNRRDDRRDYRRDDRKKR